MGFLRHTWQSYRLFRISRDIDTESSVHTSFQNNRYLIASVKEVANFITAIWQVNIVTGI